MIGNYITLQPNQFSNSGDGVFNQEVLSNFDNYNFQTDFKLIILMKF